MQLLDSNQDLSQCALSKALSEVKDMNPQVHLQHHRRMLRGKGLHLRSAQSFEIFNLSGVHLSELLKLRLQDHVLYVAQRSNGCACLNVLHPGHC